MTTPATPPRLAPTARVGTGFVAPGTTQQKRNVVRLRPWQKDALEKFLASDRPDFLAVATPGAGKTTFALAAALRSMRSCRQPRVVVVAPTAHLKAQWAQAASRFGLHLEPQWTSATEKLPADMHGIVTTYQQVATSAEALRKACAGAFVILDELHHAGDDRAWGDAVRQAFTPADRRLALSGTPFRSDTLSIPFVHYTLEEAVSDYEYGYANALVDGGVVRPAYFPRINGFMEWVAPDGSLNAASFEDALDRTRSSQRLRTALSTDGDWLPAVLRQAHDQLMVLRQRNPCAGGLVIATDQDHARAIADVFRTRLRVTPTVALSDDPDASRHIASFATADTPWIIAVRMVSEGVDIPRLQIGVYATTTTTELFFRQAVGRLVRWTPVSAGTSRKQKAYLFIPDDPRLRTWAHQITDARRHSLRKPSDDAGDALDGPIERDPNALHEPSDHLESAEQLSLFSALSAVVADGPDQVVSGVFDEDYDHDERHDGDVVHEVGDADPDFTLDIDALAPPLPRQPFSAGTGIVGFGVMSRYQQKEALRLRNADLARSLARLTGLPHRQIHTELNKQVGLRGIDEATVEQLERRAGAADRWLKRL